MVVQELIDLVNPKATAYRPSKGKVNVVMFVGLQGSGKTTTCTKYARYWMKKRFRCGLVCADTFRAGAFDQLKQNALRARIPFYGDIAETDPVKLARDGVDKFRSEGYDLIVVDTSGRHKQEDALFMEMQQVAEAVNPDDIIFVMDGSIGQAAQDHAAAFKSKVSVGSVIITKLDGHAKGGGALSAVAATQSPITFIGTGEHFDEFEEFVPQSFISRLLGMGDIRGLMQHAMDAAANDPQRHQALLKNMTQGIYTMRDLYQQLEMVNNMGPISNLISMIPGLSQQMSKLGNPEDMQANFKVFMTIIDSMTNDELDHPNILKISGIESRKIRIARGSGRTMTDVNQMFEAYKLFHQFAGQFKQISQLAGGGGGLNPQDMLKNMRGMKGMRGGRAMAGRGRGMPQQPNLNQMMGQLGMGNLGQMMNQLSGMMGGLGGMMGGGAPGGRGNNAQMPDMEQMRKMAQAMGMNLPM